MNKDQVKGAVKEVAGKVQRKAGALIDSPEQQARGAAKEVAGKVQGRIGDAKEAVKDAVKATTRKP